MRPMVVVTLGALLLAPAGVAAQHAALRSGEEAEHESHRHHLALGLDAATNQETDETGLSIGPSYRYKVSPQVSVGGIAEATFYERETAYLVLAAVFVTPYRELVLIGAPGIEVVEGETEFAFRLAAGYDIALSRRWTVTPLVALDSAGGATTLVYGAEIGIRW